MQNDIQPQVVEKAVKDIVPPIRLVRDLYFSVFLVCLKVRFGSWPEGSRGDEYGAVAVFTTFEMFLLMFLSISMGIGDMIVRNKFIGLAAMAAISIFNTYYFVLSGAGLRFEKDFRRFSGTKQITLYAVASTIIIATVVGFYMSIMAYRRARASGFYG